MTDKDIINSLEMCIKMKYCDSCPFYRESVQPDCIKRQQIAVLDLINRLQAKIKKLRKEEKL